MRTVGAYEAKTHWSELLDEVAKGETITITRRGEPVAVLAPPVREKSMDELIQEMRKLRKGQTLGGITIRELIEEGRRY